MVILGGVVVVLGIFTLVTARGVARVILQARLEQLKRSSFLSGSAIDHQRELLQTDSGKALQVWWARAFGAAMVLAGIGFMLQ